MQTLLSRQHVSQLPGRMAAQRSKEGLRCAEEAADTGLGVQNSLLLRVPPIAWEAVDVVDLSTKAVPRNRRKGDLGDDVNNACQQLRG